MFFCKKRIYKKIKLKFSKSYENLKKITRLYFGSLVFLLAENRYYVGIKFKMLKIEFKIEYTGLAMKVPVHFSKS